MTRRCSLFYGTGCPDTLVAEIRDLARQSRYEVVDWHGADLAGRQSNLPRIVEIWNSIESTQRVIGILDTPEGLNPNVFYEVGYSHGFWRWRFAPSRVVGIIDRKRESEIPFNLRGFDLMFSSDGRLEPATREKLRGILATTDEEAIADVFKLIRNRIKRRGGLGALLRLVKHSKEVLVRGAPRSTDAKWRELAESLGEFAAEVVELDRTVVVTTDKKDYRTETVEHVDAIIGVIDRLLVGLDEAIQGGLIDDLPVDVDETRKKVAAATKEVKRLTLRANRTNLVLGSPVRTIALTLFATIVPCATWAFLVDRYAQVERYEWPASFVIVCSILLVAAASATSSRFKPLWKRCTVWTAGCLLAAAVANRSRLEVDPIDWESIARSLISFALLGVFVGAIRHPRSLRGQKLPGLSIASFVVAMVALQSFLGMALRDSTVRYTQEHLGEWWTSILEIGWWQDNGSRLAIRCGLSAGVLLFVSTFLRMPWVVPALPSRRSRSVKSTATGKKARRRQSPDTAPSKESEIGA